MAPRITLNGTIAQLEQLERYRFIIGNLILLEVVMSKWLYFGTAPQRWASGEAIASGRVAEGSWASAEAAASGRVGEGE
jgi:hypothetical protein